MSETAVRLRGVSAGYRDRVVLEDIDLEVTAGETVALIGPNGSGKSTLLGVAAGTIPARSGSVALFGRPVRSLSRREIARFVSVLPQDAELPTGFRVAELVALGRLPHARSAFGPSPDDERIVAAALADAGADDLADRPVDELSGGERQRALVALALAQEPRLLLLDEPTLHLDPAHQVALVELLGRLRRTRGMTMVAVLHDIDLARRVADRVHLVHAGRVRSATLPEGGVDLSLVAHAFGVPITEAMTAGGRSVLAVGVTDSVAD
jgi:iron complex transport system ATP-binding protein